jgi:hypothetical protein
MLTMNSVTTPMTSHNTAGIPTEATLRLWGMLLYKGDAAVFNFAFTIFKLQEDSIARTPNRLELVSKILSPTFTEVWS